MQIKHKSKNRRTILKKNVVKSLKSRQIVKRSSKNIKKYKLNEYDPSFFYKIIFYHILT